MMLGYHGQCLIQVSFSLSKARNLLSKSYKTYESLNSEHVTLDHHLELLQELVLSMLDSANIPLLLHTKQSIHSNHQVRGTSKEKGLDLIVDMISP